MILQVNHAALPGAQVIQNWWKTVTSGEEEENISHSGSRTITIFYMPPFDKFNDTKTMYEQMRSLLGKRCIIRCG